jgi:hypothetical protein
MFSSREKDSPSNSVSANGSASRSQASQQLQFPTKSESQPHLRSLQQTQQLLPVHPWSAHTPPFGPSPSPFLRHAHALSTSASAAGELFLFGGYVSRSATNDLYVISTRDFSVILLETSGDIPSPRYGHRAVLTSTILLIWGGWTDFGLNALARGHDDSLYLLNLGTSDLF